MENNHFKKQNLFQNYSYRKRGIKGNQQTNILKTYNNINNEIIINIKNNEKDSDNEKKYEVRKIRLKLPNELIQKKETFDFFNLNLRNINNSTKSTKPTIPNNIIYNKNITNKNKKFNLEKLVNNISLGNKFDTSNNINNTFQYAENTMTSDINNNDTEVSIKKSEKKVNQIPFNKIKVKYYQKPFYALNRVIYHKINNLSYKGKTQSDNNSKKELILEKIKKPKILIINPILSQRNPKENFTKKNLIPKSNTNIIDHKIKYRKIKPKEKKGELREKINPINVNRRQKFFSNNLSYKKEEESNNTSNNINDNNIVNKTKNDFNNKSFRFLVSQTNKNIDLSNSFSKCYNDSLRKKPLLKSNQVFSFNDSISYSNIYNETEPNNETIYNRSTFNNNETNIKRESKFNTDKMLAINDKENLMLEEKERNKKKVNEVIRQRKYILSAFNTPKYHLINKNSRLNTHLTTSDLNVFNSDIKNKQRNILAISLSGINLDLYYLEEKMKLVIDKIRNYEKCSKECYNYIKYFFERNLFNELLKPFKNVQNYIKMENYLKLDILCYFLCYKISLSDNFKITEILLKSIFDISFSNFILYLCFVVSQSENQTDSIIIVLKKIIKDNLNIIGHDNYNIDENKYVNIISQNSKNIIDYYNIIIKNIYNKNLDENIKLNDMKFQDYILDFINNNKNNYNNEINEEKDNLIITLFFKEAIKFLNELNVEFLETFLNFILCFKNDDNNKEPNNKKDKEYNTNINTNKNGIKYFLPPIKEDKEYSLILDLEDTLIHSQRDFNFKKKLIFRNINKKKIILRPYLLEFLNEMKPLFELILFSSNTPEYVDPIINFIQKDQTYFDFILYRHHITLDDEGNNVKNLELIGRDLKKIIIVDDISRYFKLQKENGINIKPFYGNVDIDGDTLKCLGNILKKIRKDSEETNDIRISLKKYRGTLFPDVVNVLEEN